MMRTDLMDITEYIKSISACPNVSFGYPLNFRDMEICCFSTTPYGNYENDRKTRDLNIYIYAKIYSEADTLAERIEMIDLYEPDNEGGIMVGNTTIIEFRNIAGQVRKYQEGFVEAPNGQRYYQAVISKKIIYETY